MKFNNLLEFLNSVIEKNRFNEFVYSDNLGKLLYHDISFYIEEWINFFEEENIQLKPVVLVGNFDADWIIIFLSIICSGNIVVPLSEEYNIPNSLEIELSNSVFFFGDDKYSNYFKDDNSRLKLNYTKMNQDFKQNKTGIEKFKILSKNKMDLELIDAIWITTSGTTGEKKLIRLKHNNIIADILHIYNIFEDFFCEQDKLYSFLPVNHMFEITVGILMPMFYGSCICCSKYSNPIQILKKYRPTIVIAVPLILVKIKDYLQMVNNTKGSLVDTLQNIKCIICGSAPISQELIDYYQNINVKVLNGYGATECSPVISCNNELNMKCGSVGRVNIDSFCKVEIVKGEVVISGDIVSVGNKFNTGDLGYIDNDKYLFLTGRKKHIIVLKNGVKIYIDIFEKIFLDCKIELYKAVLYLSESENANNEYLTLVVAPRYMKFDDDSTVKFFNKMVSDYNRNSETCKRIKNIILKNKNDIWFEQRQDLNLLIYH